MRWRPETWLKYLFPKKGYDIGAWPETDGQKDDTKSSRKVWESFWEKWFVPLP
jgi:hypothetical protein